MVRAVSLSHQVVGSKQPLRRFAGGGLPRFFPSPDPTHVGASGTGSAPFTKEILTEKARHVMIKSIPSSLMYFRYNYERKHGKRDFSLVHCKLVILSNIVTEKLT